MRTEEAFIKLEANDKSFLGRLVLQVGGFYSKESELIRGDHQNTAKGSTPTSLFAITSRAAPKLTTPLPVDAERAGSNSLLKMTLDHCENSGVREALHLEDDFRTKHAFTCLHVWMVLRRLRKSGSEGKRVSQFFYDNFQHEVELGVHREGVRVRVNKWLRQLEDIFFGAAKAYDDAIDKHTEDFADVLYRNLYSDKGNREYCNALARYTIREMVSLSMTDTEAVLSGQVKFNASTD